MFCPVGSLTKMFFCIIGKFAGRRLSDYFKSDDFNNYVLKNIGSCEGYHYFFELCH